LELQQQAQRGPLGLLVLLVLRLLGQRGRVASGLLEPGLPLELPPLALLRA
jgi:hypothetical protein